MIPLCSRQRVSVTVDGVSWYFKPKIGALDYESAEMFGRIVSASIPDQMTMTAEMVDKVLVGWEGESMPPYEAGPSKLFSHDERVQLLILWKDANTLSPEEKKS